MRRALLGLTGLGAATVVAAAVAGVAAAAEQPPAVPGEIARGTIAERVHLRSIGNDPTDVLVQELTVKPLMGTGWHSHPGPAIVVVESGTLTLRSAHGGECVIQSYGTGDAFVDPGRGFVHSATNHSPDVPVTATVTYLLPRMAASPRMGATAPEACSG